VYAPRMIQIRHHSVRAV